MVQYSYLLLFYELPNCLPLDRCMQQLRVTSLVDNTTSFGGCICNHSTKSHEPQQWCVAFGVRLWPCMIMPAAYTV